jgi:RNase P/RNase MRP subunit p30
MAWGQLWRKRTALSANTLHIADKLQKILYFAFMWALIPRDSQIEFVKGFPHFSKHTRKNGVPRVLESCAMSQAELWLTLFVCALSAGITVAKFNNWL